MLENWLDNDIDDIYHLDNEQTYLRAVEVRGHRFRLEARCKSYLLAVANKILRNKYRRKRLK